MKINSLAIYVHIPFCLKKCNYCAFYSLPDCDESMKQEYMNAVIRQIKAFKTNRTISSIYFGGGTPPVLGAERLVSVLEEIKNNFVLEVNCEITLEANPKSVTGSELIRFYNAGFNRLSLGMQTSNDRELALLGRVYTHEEFIATERNIVAAGFRNRSTDIIFGIPEQTKESLYQSVISVIESGTPHISIYSLSIEEGTPFYRNRDKLNLPDEDTEDEMYYLICDLMEKNGYHHYEISSFALEGFESRHNLHYWDCGEYISFGSAAHSYYNGKRFSNVADVKRYITLVDDGYYSPTDFAAQPLLTEQEKAEEKIMLGLRTNRGIPADDRLFLKSKKYLENDFAVLENGYIILTEKGYRISNRIIAELLC